MKNLLTNWISSLDTTIGDTAFEIEKRKAQNSDAVKMREDLIALIEYLCTHDLPPNVERALKYCLNWNPFCKK